jgi:hypothetical protein
VKRLVVNGCSYAEWYARGNGHVDLANQLGIDTAKSLALPSSCNTRILRTSLKDSYATAIPTLYVIGLTFLGRSELPIRPPTDDFEGRWLSITNYPAPTAQYDLGWNSELVEKFIDLRLKYQLYSILDRLEDLMYLISSTINDLKSRGHQVLIFKQADDVYESMLDDPRVDLLKKSINIVDGLRWCANEWQYDRGVEWNPIDSKISLRNHRHPVAGQYQILNKFLIDYISTNQLI